MSEWRIPLSDLDFGLEEQSAVQRVLNSRWLSMGPEVQAFESEFADLIGTKHAFAVANGTAGLHLSYLALGLGIGDEVIQPAINFVAAANMTAAAGATPVFADIISLEEPTIDPADIERRITPRTKAVVVMHYGGYLCRMAEIASICQRHELALIEDACHAVGARYLNPEQKPPHDKMAGSLGDIACFSFFSNKNLATGEGGMVVTRRDDVADRIRLLRSHGMTTLTWDRHKGHASAYDVVTHGYNYRFDELRAALGRCQLSKLLHNNQRRRELVRAYRRNLESLEEWTVPLAADPGDSAYHLMAVVARTGTARLKAVQSLSKAGIQTSRHYPCITQLSAFKSYPGSGLEQSQAFAGGVVTLPLFPTLTLEQVNEICGCMGHG